MNSLLTDETKKRFHEIAQAAKDGNLAVLDGYMDNKKAGIITVVYTDDDGYSFYPKAVIILEEDEHRLLNPDKQPLKGNGE